MAGREEKSKIQKVIFDTDVLIWYFRGLEKAKTFIAEIPFEKRLIPSLVYIELFQGCLNKKEAKIVRDFVRENFFEIIHPTKTISEKAISLIEKYSLSHGLRGFDSFIAATALISRSYLSAANARHYRFIKGLKLLPFLPSNVS